MPQANPCLRGMLLNNCSTVKPTALIVNCFQCIETLQACDGWKNCHNEKDEEGCHEIKGFTKGSVPPPALITLSRDGRLISVPLSATHSITQHPSCPDTHFQCPDNGYCLPVFLRCNGVNDCSGREDETGCDACPGFYRCRDSKTCLLYSDLCDGRAICPQHDDELLCESTCPPPCVCRGMAFFCNDIFVATAYPHLRYLGASGSAMTPRHLSRNSLLIHLTLASCRLTHLDNLTLPNLLSLDIQNNQLIILDHIHLVGVPQLRRLSVAGNPLRYVFKRAERRTSFPNMKEVDLSRVLLQDFNVTVLSAFPNLRVLNLSNSGLQRVPGEGFRDMDQLRALDLRGCPMTWFPREIFHSLKRLRVVHADNFKMCCPAVLPLDFELSNCFAPLDVVSSCENLLRRNIYRVCVFVLSFLAVVGNFVSFVFRTCISKRERLGYGNFVTHLSVADFLMGIYLLSIGIADQVLHSAYLWNDIAWKNSYACQLGGFLSLLSSEVSALIVCLITLDRFLVLRFPFSQLHFRPKSAHAASAIVWICGVVLAAVPLLPVTSNWEFYGQTGICIPLPIIRTDIAGQDYAFGILIVFNFLVFVAISIGQLGVYWSVRANSMSVSSSTKKSKDLRIARRLIAVAMTDFLCWFPIGVLGLMASNGVPIPGEVNVVAAIFVLPLNSAVNPCIYTVNVILERRSRAREERLRTALLAHIKADD